MQQKFLIVMVKVPEAGRVKTRLARGIGVVQATAFYRVALRRLLRRLESPAEWQLILAIAPDVGVASACLRPIIGAPPRAVAILANACNG